MWNSVQVKEEACEWEGVSEAAAREGLYAGHEVKREVLVGPEVLQPQDAAFRLGRKFEVTVVKEELSDVESDGANNCASSEQGDYSDERCQFTDHSRQQLVLRPCTVLLERIPEEKEQHSGNNVIQHKILCPKLKEHDTHINNKTKVHTKAGTFTCDSCGLSFTLRNKIIRHLRICSHNASKVTLKITTPLSCTICNKQFKARFNLKKHKQVHSGLKPYNCEICGKQYSQSSHLYRHKRVTHASQPRNTETYCCDTCSKKYRTKYDLVIHMRIHTGQMPYICQFCGKPFNKKSTLVTHENIHTNERKKRIKTVLVNEGPYCEVCNKQFATKWNLKKHKRRHTNETPCFPYSCDVCNKKYMHSYSLDRHKRGRKHSLKILQTNGISNKDCALKARNK